ncbi:hypothetical protein GYMLUDRAFT_783238 [Collybiopsis luxurians FD-317 M1]|uniref:Uncharacterized protein n=1 Tax=Collybiopsis luxurians FD-317 M1 TaxID=944289 RepID=A0A0D0CEU1_9AGAR|nr:hypothetical protein GYMLUDRAFT_783238 [Collybiopsis luxurians FD-317 M1]
MNGYWPLVSCGIKLVSEDGGCEAGDFLTVYLVVFWYAGFHSIWKLRNFGTKKH